MRTFPEPGSRGRTRSDFEQVVDIVKEEPDTIDIVKEELDVMVDDVEDEMTVKAEWQRHRGDPELDTSLIGSWDGGGQYELEYDPKQGKARLKEPRVYRRHANAKNETTGDRKFDRTALHYDQHGRLFSHADYIAHCEKYDYVWRHIKKGDRILDVGCGTDAPLMRAINFVQSQASKVLYREGGCYVGIDLNKLKETKISWAQLIGEVDATSEAGYDACLQAIPGNVAEGNRAMATDGPVDEEELRGYSLIVCLEVIEHMGVEDGSALLSNFKDLLSKDGRIILSTPIYDGVGMARNHIHEYYVDELRYLIESMGLKVVRRMGTFTSEPQIKRWMKENRPDWLELYLEAREFHSAGYMSGVIAPMVPDFSRNNVWLLEHE